jgi:uncharacterized protein YggE
LFGGHLTKSCSYIKTFLEYYYMKTKTLGAIFLVLLLVSGTAMVSMNGASALEDGNDDKRTLTANGMYSMSVDPDTFVATIVVETEAETAQDSQRENAKLSSKVEEAVGFGELTTVLYTIQPKYEWETCDMEKVYSIVPCRERQVLVGYTTTHKYEFETKDFERGGEALDDFVSAGATRIDSIRFELSDELQSSLELELLEKAAGNAREKAEAIAKGARVTLADPLTINEGYFYAPVYYDYGYVRAEVAGADYQTTSLTPGQVDLSAQVTITYEIF